MNGTGRQLVVQLLFIAAATVIFFIIYGGLSAISAGFGGAIALANGLLLGWRRHMADSGRALSGAASMRLLYRTAIERFVLVIALFALGMGVLELEPVALLAGFIAGQLALFIDGNTRKN